MADLEQLPLTQDEATWSPPPSGNKTVLRRLAGAGALLGLVGLGSTQLLKSEGNSSTFEPMEKEEAMGPAAEEVTALFATVATGKQACENQGHDQGVCLSIGCCWFTMGKCWSAVGEAACATIPAPAPSLPSVLAANPPAPPPPAPPLPSGANTPAPAPPPPTQENTSQEVTPAPPQSPLSAPTQKLEEEASTTGATTTTEAPCYQTGVYFKGGAGEISSFAQSAEVCHARCLASPACAYFSYQEGPGDCYMMPSLNATSDIEGWISGPRQCVGACFVQDVVLIGDQVAATSTEPSADACYEMCSANPQCQTFTYETRSLRCHLLNNPSTGAASAGFIVGPRECAAEPTTTTEDPGYIFEVDNLTEDLYQSEYLSKYFDKMVTVFGMPVLAEPDVPEWALQHVAAVLAEFIDNDEDGAVDNPSLLEALHANRAELTVFASKTEPLYKAYQTSYLAVDDAVDLSTIPTRLAPTDTSSERRLSALAGISMNDKFDGTLEEVMAMLLKNGYSQVYPSQFGIQGRSELTKFMYEARTSGKFHSQTPDCDRQCQAVQYQMWTLFSLLDAFDGEEILGSNGKSLCADISSDWELCNSTEVQTGNPGVAQLYDLENANTFGFPTRLPNGIYLVSNFTGADEDLNENYKS